MGYGYHDIGESVDNSLQWSVDEIIPSWLSSDLSLSRAAIILGAIAVLSCPRTECLLVTVCLNMNRPRWLYLEPSKRVLQAKYYPLETMLARAYELLKTVAQP